MAKKKSRAKSPRRSRFEKLIRWLVALGLVGVVAIAALYFFGGKAFKHSVVTIDRKEYPVMGIDISSHNGPMNFTKVAADGINFVYAKSSEGETFKDPAFAANVRKARAAGLITGAYHYFHMKGDGKRQAANFISAVKDVPLDMPLVIDVEDWGNAMFFSRDEAVSELGDMIANLKRSGYRVMIYTNGDGYDRYVKEKFRNEDLWLCSFKQPEKLRDYHRMQQFSHWGQVNGVDGDVDLDVFNGSENQWLAWLRND